MTTRVNDCELRGEERRGTVFVKNGRQRDERECLQDQEEQCVEDNGEWCCERAGARNMVESTRGIALQQDSALHRGVKNKGRGVQQGRVVGE